MPVLAGIDKNKKEIGEIRKKHKKLLFDSKFEPFTTFD